MLTTCEHTWEFILAEGHLVATCRCGLSVVVLYGDDERELWVWTRRGEQVQPAAALPAMGSVKRAWSELVATMATGRN